MGRSTNTTRQLYNEQGGVCYYCNTDMLWTLIVDNEYRKDLREKLATFDHIKLKSAGGTWAKANGVCACWKCNTMRSNLPQDVFIENFDFISEQWTLGNRTPNMLHTGEVICISKAKYKRFKRNQKRRDAQTKRASFIVAHAATLLGATLDDFALTHLFSTTYDMIEETL